MIRKPIQVAFGFAPLVCFKNKALFGMHRMISQTSVLFAVFNQNIELLLPL